MRIKIKSLEQIREDMSHNDQYDLDDYTCGLYESELSAICGQWHSVSNHRRSMRYPEYMGYVIDALGSSRLTTYFIISYLVDEISEDEF